MIALLGWAQAAEISVGAVGAVADGAAGVPGWAGVQGAVEVPWGRWAVGGRVRAGWSGDPVVTAAPTGRLWLSDPARTSLSASVAAGLQLDGRATALLSPGLALDVGPRGSTRPRIEASYDYAPGADVWRLSLAASAVFGRRAPEPEPVVEVPPPPPGTMVWVADPVCGWLDADAVLDATLAAEPSAWLDADGLRATAAALAGAPEDRANLVVAGWLGDRIEVDGQRVEMGEDGLAVVVRAPGPGEIRVVGGGRVEQVQIGVGNHQGLWFAVPPPAEVQIGFSVGSSRVDDVQKARLAEMAANAGGWGFEVRGGHSPEGDTARNLALAVARAEAVAAELRALGVPTVRVAERIEVFDAGAPPETLRVAIVTPIVAETAP